MDPPKVGDRYGDRDLISRYRVEVVEVDRDLWARGLKGVRLRNLATGRTHWTTPRRLYRAYRKVGI